MHVRVIFIGLLLLGSAAGDVALAEPACQMPPDSASVRSRVLGATRLLPTYVDGKMVGLTVDQIDPDSLLAPSDLRVGDMIVAVNGLDITNPKSGKELLCRLGRSEPVTIHVERDSGERVPITIAAAA